MLQLQILHRSEISQKSVWNLLPICEVKFYMRFEMLDKEARCLRNNIHLAPRGPSLLEVA